jgi:hypothetical protein
MSNVIKKAKSLKCNQQIINSHNKINTLWYIIKSDTGKKAICDDTLLVNKDDDDNNNCKFSSELFNNYFLMIAEKNSCNILNSYKADGKNNINPIHYLSQIFKSSFPNIKPNKTSIKEIENIINSLQSKN